MSDDNERELTGKYEVSRVDGQEMPNGCVVLEFSDRNAWTALWHWSEVLEDEGYEQLAKDVREQLSEVVREVRAQDQIPKEPALNA